MDNLKKYLDYEFSSGPYTGKDYLSFQTKYINCIKRMCNDNDWELVRALKNHYEFSAFLRCNDKYIYISICDVRYFRNEWWNNVLVRSATSDKDYRGGRNNYSALPNLAEAIKAVLND